MPWGLKKRYTFTLKKVDCTWKTQLGKTLTNATDRVCVLADGIWNDEQFLYDNCVWRDLPSVFASGVWLDNGIWNDNEQWSD